MGKRDTSEGDKVAIWLGVSERKNESLTLRGFPMSSRGIELKAEIDGVPEDPPEPEPESESSIIRASILGVEKVIFVTVNLNQLSVFEIEVTTPLFKLPFWSFTLTLCEIDLPVSPNKQFATDGFTNRL